VMEFTGALAAWRERDDLAGMKLTRR